MARTTLLRRVEGLELWTTMGETAQHYAVKLDKGRLRVVDTLAQAEALLAAASAKARIARAH